MSELSANWTALGYLVAAVCFILALKGLSSPKTARRGNQIGAFGAVLAVLVAFFSEDLHHIPLILIAIVIGTVAGRAGRPAGRDDPDAAAGRAVQRRRRRRRPRWSPALELTQTHYVASLDTSRRGSAARTTSRWRRARSRCWSGRVSFAGSCITFAKLQELMTGRAITYPGGQYVFSGALGLAVVAGRRPGRHRRRRRRLAPSGWLLGVLALVSLVVGVLFVLPVGGADVPIVISLLNAFTGLTVAASGYVLSNTLLLVAGTLVGASGTILTRLMAAAMGRSLLSILFGAFRPSTAVAAGLQRRGPAGAVRLAAPTWRSCSATPAR